MKKLLVCILAFALAISMTSCTEEEHNSSGNESINEEVSSDNIEYNYDSISDNSSEEIIEKIIFEYSGIYTAGIDFPTGEYSVSFDGDIENLINFEVFTFENDEPVSKLFYKFNALGHQDISDVINNNVILETGSVFCFNVVDTKGNTPCACVLTPTKLYDNNIYPRENTAKDVVELSAGEYKVGEDIDEGIYDVYLYHQYYSAEEVQEYLDGLKEGTISFFDDSKNVLMYVFIIRYGNKITHDSFNNINIFDDYNNVFKNVPLENKDTIEVRNCDVIFVPSK